MENEIIEGVLEQLKSKLGNENMDEKLLMELVQSTAKRVVKNNLNSSIGFGGNKREVKNMSSPSAITEFVGSSPLGDTVGLVIANVDPSLHEKMGIDKKYRSIGIISDRTGAGPQIMAADEAVKATNTEVISIEFPRDTKGGAGHGSLIILASEDVSDSRRAVEVALKEIERTMGDVYGCDAGHLEFQYTARASYAIEKAFGAPIGKAFGLIVGAPAGIGVVMSDTALKTANVELISYASPKGGSHANEVTICITGDSGAVRQSIIAAREVGLQILRSMGQNPVSTTHPYI